MDISVNTESGYPIYRQIIEQISQMAVCGMLKTDEQLPSVRELSNELSIAPNTVARAYRDLKQKKVIYSRWGEGNFISGKLHSPSSAPASMIRREEAYTLDSEAAMKTADTLGSSNYVQRITVREQKYAVLAIKSEGHLHGDLNRLLVSNLQKKGIIPISVHLDDDRASLERALDQVMSVKHASIIIEGVDGGIIMDSLEAKASSLDSVVFIIDKPRHISGKFKSHSVISDRWYGAYMATKHLIGLGHRKIMVLGYEWIHNPEQYRYSDVYMFDEGYRAALKEAGLQDSEQYIHEASCNSGSLEAFKSKFTEFLNAGNLPTAIVSSADFRLTTKLDCFRKAGIRIPEDMSLIGYFNTPWSTLTDIQLTSVSIREDQIAMKTAEILAGEDKSSEIIVKPELIIRKSCATCKQ